MQILKDLLVHCVSYNKDRDICEKNEKKSVEKKNKNLKCFVMLPTDL